MPTLNRPTAGKGKRIINTLKGFTFDPKTGYFVKMLVAGPRKDTRSTQAGVRKSPGSRSAGWNSRCAWPATPARGRAVEPTGRQPIRSVIRIRLPSAGPLITQPDRSKVAPTINDDVDNEAPDTLLIPVVGKDRERDLPTKRCRSHSPGRTRAFCTTPVDLVSVAMRRPHMPSIVNLSSEPSPVRCRTAKQRSASVGPPVARLSYTHAPATRPSKPPAPSEPAADIDELRPLVKTVVIEPKLKPPHVPLGLESANAPQRERQKILDDESIAIWLVTQCNAPSSRPDASDEELGLAAGTTPPIQSQAQSSATVYKGQRKQEKTCALELIGKDSDTPAKVAASRSTSPRKCYR